MTERMGFVKLPTDGASPKMRAKAMIIGATGSIGRVSSLLVSLAFDELVLVATRPDKLLELRQEILDLSPNTKVTVTTNANSELTNTDLIVTATSNQSGDILDIMQVKPGAVICDCSRPLDIGPEQAAKRPDVMVIESGEITLPGNVNIDCSIGLPKPSVYACLAETVLLTMEGRYESYSLSKQLSMEKVKEIYKLGLKHGATLSTICGTNGVITEEQIEICKTNAREKLKTIPKPLRSIPPDLPKLGEMTL
jgi:predicted amino acid dehydrogenase